MNRNTCMKCLNVIMQLFNAKNVKLMAFWEKIWKIINKINVKNLFNAKIANNFFWENDFELIKKVVKKLKKNVKIALKLSKKRTSNLMIAKNIFRVIKNKIIIG